MQERRHRYDPEKIQTDRGTARPSPDLYRGERARRDDPHHKDGHIYGTSLETERPESETSNRPHGGRSQCEDRAPLSERPAIENDMTASRGRDDVKIKENHEKQRHASPTATRHSPD